LVAGTAVRAGTAIEVATVDAGDFCVAVAPKPPTVG
jgi:hypothetical protein